MEPDHRRHDIGDRGWAVLEPLLPGRAGRWGGVAEDNGRFVDAVFWALRTGSPWRDLPPDYGGRKNAHRRFCRRGARASGSPCSRPSPTTPASSGR